MLMLCLSAGDLYNIFREPIWQLRSRDRKFSQLREEVGSEEYTRSQDKLITILLKACFATP